MQTSDISFKRHRFPPHIVAHTVWLYLRFNLSLREVEKMLLERGINVSYEIVRRWIAKFGPGLARNLRRRQARPGDIWYFGRSCRQMRWREILALVCGGSKRHRSRRNLAEAA